MRLTRFADYGITTLAHLAQRSGARASVPEIAQRYNLSTHHLGKVVHALGKAGFLKTIRGHGGGLELALPPERIRLGDVIRELQPGDVAVAPGSAMGPALDAATDAFLGALDNYTISDILPTRRAA
jgi:Rrf2 family nitric oxide-sensitive transcriptional repressor